MDNFNYIIGTAGHIDHGKTELIKALTGEDTDRLSEEKERGISIDLGFSRLELDNGTTLGIIDVPGHEKFIKNMLAGAGGVDIALLVVDATEGVMAQTKEHLAILDLLGVQQGLVVVTKIDLIEDQEWLELVIEDTREKVEDTFLAGAPVIPVSAVENRGIDNLKAELKKLLQKLPPREPEGFVYFPIDRVFSLTGHGTVVTGTLVSGTINIDDNLEVYPSRKDVRVRGLQVHNTEQQVAYPGQRVGINLAGVDTGELDRGDVLAAEDSLESTRYIDGRLNLISDLPFVLEHADRIRFHIGAAEVIGRVYLLDSEQLEPGESGFVQFRLEEEIVANHHERYVVRRYSPMDTIGGGIVIDNNPPRRRRFSEDIINDLRIKEQGTPAEIIELIIKLREEPVDSRYIKKRITLSDKRINEILHDLADEGRIKKFNYGNRILWMHIVVYKRLREEIEEILKDFHNSYPLRQGLPKEELRTQLSLELDINIFNQFLRGNTDYFNIRESFISLRDFSIRFTEEQKRIKQEIIDYCKKLKFKPPVIDDLQKKIKGENFTIKEVFNSLYQAGEFVKLDEDIYLYGPLLEKAEQLLRDYLQEHDSIELSTYRDILDSSRKYTLPLIQYFDNKGLTVRKGDKRVLR